MGSHNCLPVQALGHATRIGRVNLCSHMVTLTKTRSTFLGSQDGLALGQLLMMVATCATTCMVTLTKMSLTFLGSQDFLPEQELGQTMTVSGGSNLCNCMSPLTKMRLTAQALGQTTTISGMTCNHMVTTDEDLVDILGLSGPFSCAGTGTRQQSVAATCATAWSHVKFDILGLS